MTHITHSKLTAKQPWMFQSRRRLFFTLFILLALPTAILTLLTANFVWVEGSRDAMARTSVTSRLVSKHLEEEFFGLRSYVESFATRWRVVESVKSGDLDAAQQELADMTEQNKKLSRAVITDPMGVLWADYPHDPTVIGKNFSTREWYKGVSQSERSYVSGAYERAALGEAVVVMIATKLRDREGRLLGYLGAQYAVRDLMRWLASVQTSEFERIAVFDHHEKQVLLVNAASHLDVSRNPGIRRLLHQPEGRALVDDVDGFGRSIVAHTPVPELGWTVIVYADQTAFLAPVKRMIGTILIFFLVSMAALALLGWLWHRVLYSYAEDLRRSNKELENVFYSIAHDLRSPVRAMHGFATVIDEDFGEKLGETGRQYTHRLKAAAHRMDRLILDLLDYGGIAHRKLEFQKIGLGEAVQKALQTLSIRIEQTGADIEVREPLGHVAADDYLLKDVLQQLLGNALKFVAPGVKPKIEVWTESDKSSTRLWIKDNGIGILTEHQGRIFGVFQRLHDNSTYSGTGVGLAIVKKAVERMGGRIGLTSQPGMGSTFWIDLPNT